MTWQFDTSHSYVEFAAKHMMVSTVKGRFKVFGGAVDLNEANHTASSVTFEIDAASIDTNEDRRDGHLKSPDFLDVAKYPKITFTSTSIDKISDTEFKVTGDLTIRDVTKPATFDVEQTGHFKTMQGVNAYSFEIKGKINRKDYGLNWNVALEAGGWLVGEEVKVTVETEVTEVAPATATA